MVASWTLASATQTLLTDEIINLFQSKSSGAKKMILSPKVLQQGAADWCSCWHLCIAMGSEWLYLNHHVRLLEHCHVKCLILLLSLPMAYQSIPEPKISVTFLCGGHPVSIHTRLHLPCFPEPELSLHTSWCRRPTNISELIMYIFLCMFYLLNKSTCKNNRNVLNFIWKAHICITIHDWHSIAY